MTKRLNFIAIFVKGYAIDPCEAISEFKFSENVPGFDMAFQKKHVSEDLDFFLLRVSREPLFLKNK